MRIKSLLITAVLTTAILCSGSIASAQTDTQTLIAQLQAQIASLMAQIQALQAQQGTAAWCYTFNVNLGVGSNSTDVSNLRSALEKENLGVNFYAGETGIYQFSESVATAVSAFQQRYASEILTPSGLKYPTGYVGPATRAKLNALYGCGIITCPGELPNCPVGTTPQSFVGTDGCTHWNCVPQITQCQTDANCPTIYCIKAPCLMNKCVNGKCVFTSADSSITINSVSGPNSLNVGQTGTWMVNATAPSGTNLTYSVDWGDNYSPTTGLKLNSSPSVGQTSTFTHSYSQAGTYTVRFTVSDGLTGCSLTYCPSHSAQTSITVVVGNTTQPSITVISPNGGEVWKVGTVQNIRWTEINSKTHRVQISAVLRHPCSYGPGPCITIPPISYLIASNVNSDSGNYSWQVGQGEFGDSIPAGQYQIQIYERDTTYDSGSGAGYYDMSDNYFSIVAPSTPSITINSVSGPTSLAVGQTGTWAVNATAPSGTNLTYLVDWGDVVYPTATGVSMENIKQTSTFTHSYSQAGTYTIRFKVIDSNVCTVTASCDKSAQASITVMVGGYNNTLSITGPSDLSGFGGVPYNKTFSVSQSSVTSSSRHYTWSITNGVLPAGLQLLNRMIACSQALCVAGQYCPPCPDGSNEVGISGTPTRVGDFPFTLVVTDDLGNRGSDNFKISIGSISLPVCTQDVYTCPNGLMVGRTGPNCEFICPNTGCTSASGYSSTTGQDCGCTSASGYSSNTGEYCGTTPTYPSGCTSTQGYSSTTGFSCGSSI